MHSLINVILFLEMLFFLTLNMKYVNEKNKKAGAAD